MGLFDPDRGGDRFGRAEARRLRDRQRVEELLAPVRARAFAKAENIASEHLPPDEVDKAAKSIADAYISNAVLSLSWPYHDDNGQLTEPPPSVVAETLRGISDVDIERWVRAAVLREAREGRIKHDAWLGIAGIAKQALAWHDFGWASLVRRATALERRLIGKMFLDGGGDLQRLAKETGLSIFSLAKLYLSVVEQLRRPDPSDYEAITGSPKDVLDYLEIPHIDDIEFAVSRVWAKPLIRTWLHSQNSHLEGARPIDVLRVDGPGRVLDALDEEAAGAYA